MTDAKTQPSFRRGLAIIVVGYVIAWHLAFFFLKWDELMQSPREFFSDYGSGAPWMLVPFLVPGHAEPLFVQLIALGAGIVLTLGVVAYLSWKRMGEND